MPRKDPAASRRYMANRHRNMTPEQRAARRKKIRAWNKAKAKRDPEAVRKAWRDKQAKRRARAALIALEAVRAQPLKPNPVALRLVERAACIARKGYAGTLKPGGF